VPTLISGRELKLAEIGLNLLILLAKVSENVKLLRLRALTTMTIKRDSDGSQEKKDLIVIEHTTSTQILYLPTLLIKTQPEPPPTAPLVHQ